MAAWLASTVAVLLLPLRWVASARGDILGLSGLCCPIVAAYLTWGPAGAFWVAGPLLLVIARLYGGNRG